MNGTTAQARFPTPELTPAEFDSIRKFLHEVCGIEMRQGKESLVRSRLSKRLKATGIRGFGEYLSHAKRDQDELSNMIDVLTTNKTSFFREREHFDVMAAHLARAPSRNPITIWSAGCSTGQEPYTLAMALEELPGPSRRPYRILATDLSSEVLADAQAATYRSELLQDIPPALKAKYTKTTKDGFTISQRLRDKVTFARLNLMSRWPMRGPFDFIFCRNVMIYFGQETRCMLANRFAKLLHPGGLLMIGMAETLTGLDHPLRCAQPSVYQK